MILEGPVSFRGKGLHGARPGEVVVHPGPPAEGILVRTPTGDVPIAQMRRDGSRRCSTLVHEPSGFRFAGSEHLLAALAGLELWDTILDVKGDEIPVLDGSAALFAQRLVRSSHRGSPPIDALTVQEPIRVRSRDGFVEAVPARVPSIHICIVFENPLVGRQHWSWKRDPDSFLHQLASARTFGFIEELPELRALGLAGGADLECALVFGPDSVLNPEGLRFPEEPVRHKLLDVLGDLALLGRPLLARVQAERPSHALVHRFVQAVLES